MELDELPSWTTKAGRPEKNAVLSKIAALTESEADAVTVLVWLLVPGAVRLAQSLSDLHADSDGLVAGQLWIQASRAHELSGNGVAAAVLGATRRGVLADLGVGDLAMRRDLVWAESVLATEFADAVAISPSADRGEPLEPGWALALLEMDAMEDKAIETFDCCFIRFLAEVAHEMDAPVHRGRAGLTSPAVIERLAWHVHLSPRALRTRVAKALDRLREYAMVREDPERLAQWRKRRPLDSLRAGDEMQLIFPRDEEGEYAYWVRDQDRESVETAMGIEWPPRSASA